MVTTTVSRRDTASSLAHAVVEAHLAACAQVIGPIESTYWWEGRVNIASEYAVVMKTAGDRYQELERHILGHHEDVTPEIIATPIVAGSTPYLRWVTTETRSR